VTIGEWGSINKDNLTARIEHAKFYMAEAKKRGIAALWWDNNLPEPGEQTFGLFDRETLTWSHPEIVDAIIAAAAGTHVTRELIPKQDDDKFMESRDSSAIFNVNSFPVKLFNLQGKQIPATWTGAGPSSYIPDVISTGSYILRTETPGETGASRVSKLR
jgi:hypothetical protein